MELPPGFLAVSCRRNALQTAISAGTEQTAGQLKKICAGPHKPMVCSLGKAQETGFVQLQVSAGPSAEVAEMEKSLHSLTCEQTEL